jgi:hypothetical protein
VKPCSLVDVNLSEELSAFLFSYAMKCTAEYGFEALMPVCQTSVCQSCKAVMSVFTRLRVSDLIHNHIDQWNSTLPQHREHCCFTFGRFLVCISPLRCFVRRFVVALQTSRQQHVYDTVASPDIVSSYSTIVHSVSSVLGELPTD